MAVTSSTEKSKQEEIIDLDSSPPECSDVELLLPTKQTSSRLQSRDNISSRLGLLCSLLAFTGLALVSLMLYGRVVRWNHHGGAEQPFQTRTEFRGTDGVDVVQHLTSSVADNYVIYHVIKPQEQMWIVDDFAANVQVMKVESEDEAVCYVTSLNRSLATLPSSYMSTFSSSLQKSSRSPQQQQQRVQTIFTASDVSVDDLKRLGSRTMELCVDVPVYWVSPVTVLTTDTHSNPLTVASREKRNVKKCIESCCYLVCCCNQKFLQWQSDDSFNCNHVCKGCTERSQTSVQQKC